MSGIPLPVTPTPGRDLDFSKTCLYFGTFNPIHLGHLIMAEAVLEQFGFEEIRFIPACCPPHRQGELEMAPGVDRLKMVQLATWGHPRFSVWGIEFERSEPSYTVETLRHILQVYPGAVERAPDGRIPVIMGADAIANVGGWYEAEALIGMVRFLQAPRLPDGFTSRVRVGEREIPVVTEGIEVCPIGISSTEVRRRCRAGKRIRYMVPEGVRGYLEANGLYRG